MWFKVLSFTIAFALIGKASIALAFREKFYASRSRQYVAKSQPRKLLVASIIVGTLTLVAWYATIFHYRTGAWAVTGFFTLLSCMAVDHVFHWGRHREKMHKIVTHPNVWWIDCVLLIVGAGFLALALLFY
jgi:hypothetical protein